MNTGSYFCSLRHAAAENLSSGIPLSVSVSPPKLLPWQRAANRGWEEEKKEEVGGLQNKKKHKKKTKLLLRTIYVNSLPSCEVNSCRTFAPPPQSKQRDGAGSESANTPSDGLKWGSAKHCMCEIKEKKEKKRFKSKERRNSDMSVSACTQRMSVGGWLRKDTKKITLKYTRNI